MSKERQRRLFEIVDRAHGLTAEHRRAYLDDACGEDGLLRQEAEALLANGDESPALGRPAFNVHAEDGAVGRHIGPYHLVELLDRGGMGSVYRAERDDFHKQVALKLIRRGLDGDAELVQRFENERQILAQLDHPHIARLLDGGATDEQIPYFVMELVSGQPLDTYCKTQRLSVDERLKIFRKVCAAVHFAHQNLVIHRDLKPGNILIGDDGQPKLLDFGIAKLLDDSRAAQPVATETGHGLMTPRYASPEQIRHQSLTTASDIYSLGVLLYELLTGVDPYNAETRRPDEISRAICEEEPARPSTAVKRRLDQATPQARRLRRRLSGDLDCIILKAMRKEPGQRYGSAEEMSRDIERHLEGLPVGAQLGTLSYRASKFVRRHWVPLVVATAFLVMVAGLGILAAFQWKRAEAETTRAEEEASLAEQTLVLFEETFQIVGPTGEGPEPSARDLLREAQKKALREGIRPKLRLKVILLLGQIYKNIGDTEDAIDLMEQCVEAILEASTNIDPPEIATCESNLAAIAFEEGYFAAAEESFREILKLRQDLGQKGSELWKTKSNLASALTRQGTLEEAGALFAEVHTGRLATYGPQDIKMVASHLNLGNLFFSQGDFDNALEHADAADKIIIAQKKANLEYRSNVLNLQANILAALGQGSKARELYLEALSFRTETLNKAEAELTRDDPPKPKRSYERAAISVAIIQKNLAAVLIDSDPQEAEGLLAEAIATLGTRPNSWLLDDAQSALGALRTSQRRFEEAEELLTQAHRKLSEVHGAHAYPAVRALDRRIALYDAWGRPEEAERLRAQRPRLPADDPPTAPGDPPADNPPSADGTGDPSP